MNQTRHGCTPDCDHAWPPCEPATESDDKGDAAMTESVAKTASSTTVPEVVRSAAQRLRDDLTYGANTNTPAARDDVMVVANFVLASAATSENAASQGQS